MKTVVEQKELCDIEPFGRPAECFSLSPDVCWLRWSHCARESLLRFLSRSSSSFFIAHTREWLNFGASQFI
jgi:hypothetical protein